MNTLMVEQLFNPEKHEFRKLDMDGPGDLVWFEKCFPGLGEAGYDPLRLNVYLTRDHDYTTIWLGFIDSAIAEMKLGFFDDPSINFSEMYELTYFRGDIQDDAFGQHVLKAIRIERVVPNALRLNDNKQLECYSLSPTG